jgi:hypothetical protein
VDLKDLPAGAREPVVTPPPPGANGGRRPHLQSRLHRCHEADGSGAPRVILDGAQTVTTPRAPNTGSMPAYSRKLSDQEIAEVANYIRNSWGKVAPAVTPGQVAKARRMQ